MIYKVLFVDDESSILDGYKRMLHREFQVDTAVGGLQGLALIRDHGPYSVVISDMRMPEMNGAQFLSQVRKTVPDTVRMLLTGYTDIGAAMEAVNQGSHQRRRLSVPAGIGREGASGRHSDGKHQGDDGCLERSQPRGLWKIDAHYALRSPHHGQVQSELTVALRDSGYAFTVGLHNA